MADTRAGESSGWSRRGFLGASLAGAALLTELTGVRAVRAGEGDDTMAQPKPEANLAVRIYKACKWGTVQADLPLADYLRLHQDLGFDGMEANSPSDMDWEALRRASEETGMPVHGVVNSTHWNIRLSDPDPAVREQGRASLETSLRDAHRVGGSAVLLVPGAVRDAERENAEQVWERSIEQIRQVLPLAAKLGVRVLIENVWNGFLYTHDGPNDQTADQLVAYLDAIDSPWVGSYFDLGNHQKYGRPADWIRTLGRRIVKLDVKDWGVEGGFTELGQGDLDWPAIRQALLDIGYTGWATAEVQGGPPEYVREKISEPMDRLLLGL